MKTKILAMIMLTSAALYADEPRRDAGISLHILPDGVAEIDGTSGGFTLTKQGQRSGGKTYSDVSTLLEEISRQPAEVLKNGVWIVYSNPVAYEEAEVKRFAELVAKLKERGVAVFTCRASKLSAGEWNRDGVME